MCGIHLVFDLIDDSMQVVLVLQSLAGETVGSRTGPIVRQLWKALQRTGEVLLGGVDVELLVELGDELLDLLLLAGHPERVLPFVIHMYFISY